MNKLKQTSAFSAWLGSLRDKRAKTVIAARLLRLANGLPGDVQPVGAGISELRIHFGPGYRLYYQQRGKLIILLLCGGSKNTQHKDIVLAKLLAKDWEHEEDFDDE